MTVMFVEAHTYEMDGSDCPPMHDIWYSSGLHHVEI